MNYLSLSLLFCSLAGFNCFAAHKEEAIKPWQAGSWAQAVELGTKEKMSPSQMFANCASANRADLLKQALDTGIPVDTIAYNETALSHAAYSCCTQAVGLLLAHKANPNCQTKYGATPLFQTLSHLMSQHRENNIDPKAKAREETINLLLGNKADPNIKPNNGPSPLELAQKDPHIKEIFAKHGYSVN